MISAVSGFLTWCAESLPDFLFAHPVIDILGVAVGIWVIALVFRLLTVRF